MAIDLYIPYKLESELERFKQNKGNINLDYRSNNVSTPHILDTSYTKLTETSTIIEADISPFVVPSSHVSGNIENYRNITTDVLVKNESDYQTNVVVLNILDDAIHAYYDKTMAVRVGATNTLVHTYNTLEPVENGTTLVPVYFISQRNMLGIVDKKLCELLYLDTIPSLVSVTVTDSTITVVQTTTNSNGHNVVLDPDTIDESIRRLSIFLKKDSIKKSTTKFRIVSNIDPNSSTVNPNPLSDLVPNYNLLYSVIGDNIPTPLGICFSLKSGESVLLNTVIQSDLTPYDGKTMLGISSLLPTEGYTGGLHSYFASIKFELPTTKPVDEFFDEIPFYLVINNSITQLQNYIDGEFDNLFNQLESIFTPYKVKLVKRMDNTIFFFSENSIDLEIVFGYKKFTITTVEDVSLSESIYSQPNLTYTEEGYPTNLSLSYAEDIDLEGVTLPSDVDLSFFCLNLSKNLDKKSIEGFFSYATYSVDLPLLKASKKKVTIEEGSVIKEIELNYVGTLLTDSKLLEAIAVQLTSNLTSSEVVVENSNLKFKNKLNTFIDYKIGSEVLTIDPSYSGIYRKENDKDVYYLSRGV